MSTISKFAGRVVCTKAQFDALAEKDPNKEYLVTDDYTYTISAESTNDQYPSAKAVYDFVYSMIVEALNTEV